MPHTDSLNARQGRNPHGEGRYIPALDGWRAVAIVLVMVFHALYNVISPGDGVAMSRSLQAISHLGALGVLIFFAISGYIITTRLYAESAGGRIRLRVFYAKRCFRILPALWIYLLTLGMLAVLGRIRLVRADALAPIFLSNYFPGSQYTLHFWSLSIEEHFYLLWPLCLLVAGWRRAIAVGACLMVLVGAYRAVRLTALGVDAGAAIANGARGRFLAHTEARMDYILAGCVLALLLIFYPAVSRFVWLCGSGVGSVVLVLFIFLSSRVGSVDVRTLQAIAIALLVVGTSVCTAGSVHRILSQAAFTFPGKLSYSLYLWQQLFLARTSVGWLQSPVALLPRVGGAVLAAWLSYRFIERPMIRLGARYLQRWNAAA